jgi:hypothetical protein
MLNSFHKETMIVKTGNPILVEKIFDIAIYDDHMVTMIKLWFDMCDDPELGDWLLEGIQDYILEADYNVGTC